MQDAQNVEVDSTFINATVPLPLDVEIVYGMVKRRIHNED